MKHIAIASYSSRRLLVVNCWNNWRTCLKMMKKKEKHNIFRDLYRFVFKTRIQKRQKRKRKTDLTKLLKTKVNVAEWFAVDSCHLDKFFFFSLSNVRLRHECHCCRWSISRSWAQRSTLRVGIVAFVQNKMLSFVCNIKRI